MAKFNGWIRSIRESKEVTFVDAYYGLTRKQLVIGKGTSVEGELKVGASVQCNGSETYNPKTSCGIDFNCTSVTVIGPSDDEYPIQPKAHSMEFLRSIPTLRGRTRTFQLIWETRRWLLYYLDAYTRNENLCEYTPPIVLGSDFEGPGMAFKVNTPWMETDLSVSAQLHLEVGLMSMGDVYCLQPCFRAEKSPGRRHLAEFWMLEAEMGFKERYQIMDILRKILSNSGGCLSNTGINERKELGLRTSLPPWLLSSWNQKWPRITYKEVCENYDVAWGQDIPHSVEEKLCKDNGNTAVYITDHAAIMKPFYMKLNDDGETVKSFDLIFPEVGEVAGGSLREENYDKLLKAMEERGMGVKSMEWYLETRRWGTIPHGGFGVGVERFLAFLLGINNIADTIPIPISY